MFQNFPSNLLSDLAAEILIWAGLGFAVWLWLSARRRRFLQFFGLGKNKTLVVYLSNLWAPNSEKQSAGCTIAGQEFRVVKSFFGPFGGTRLRFPDILEGLVDSLWIGDKIKKEIEVSSRDDKDIDLENNMIVIGGTPKNSVRRYFFKKRWLSLVIDGEADEPPPSVFDKPLKPRILILKGHRAGNPIAGEYNFAVIEKLFDKTNETTVFMCAGYRGDSSWLATEYLLRHWGDLHKEFVNERFALCLKFRMTDEYLSDYEEPIGKEVFQES